MAAISTIKELEELKQSVKPRFLVREDHNFGNFKSAKAITIRICRGSGCNGSGSKKIGEAFEEEVGKRQLGNKTTIIGTGCQKYAANGTTFPFPEDTDCLPAIVCIVSCRFSGVNRKAGGFNRSI